MLFCVGVVLGVSQCGQNVVWCAEGGDERRVENSMARSLSAFGQSFGTWVCGR